MHLKTEMRGKIAESNFARCPLEHRATQGGAPERIVWNIREPPHGKLDRENLSATAVQN